MMGGDAIQRIRARMKARVKINREGSSLVSVRVIGMAKHARFV
jgi:hypothetical protein